MTDSGNAFQRAADALAQVRDFVVSGDQLRNDLRNIASGAEASAKQVEQSLKNEIATIARLAEDVLAQYRATAKDLSVGVRSSNDQLEATTAQIRAAAVETMSELRDRADAALKRVSAEMTIAQDRYEKSAAGLQAVASGSAERITQETQGLEKAAAELGARMKTLSEQLSGTVSGLNRKAEAIRETEKAIRDAAAAMAAAQAEVVQAREEVTAMKQAMALQTKFIVASVIVLAVSTIGVGAWLYQGLRQG